MNDLKEQKVKTLKERLKNFPVRYSSFSHTYPKDAYLPACTLAQYGFYYDDIGKLIRCFECDFEYDNLQQGLLTTIIHKHYKHNMTCEQVLNALGHFFGNETERSKDDKFDLNQLKQQLDKSLTSLIKAACVEPDKRFTSVEARLKTFDKTRLLLDRNELVQNGLYLNEFNSASQLNRIVAQVPGLVHLKCAFCTYECVLFKNSLVNTFFKSPTEEHREKFANICSVFIGDKLGLCWFKSLIELDSVDLKSDSSLMNEIILPSDNTQFNTNDLTVRQMPKVIDQLILIENNKNDSLIYMPNAKGGQQITTSDFNRLQNVLNLSENVISEAAHHPAFSTYEARLESFGDWSPNHAQKPSDLAKAGFYYYGIKDMVKCFFCNGGLKNWEKDDDPYQDHVRWFPKCQFVKQLMGPKYIEAVKEKFKGEDSGFTQEIEPQSPVKLLDSKSPSNNEPDKQDEALKAISDFIICHLDSSIQFDKVRTLMMVQFGVDPIHIRFETTKKFHLNWKCFNQIIY